MDESLLQESAEDLYEQAPCGYVSTDPDGLILKVNGTFLKLTGYERSELLGSVKFPALLTAGGRIYYDTHFTLMLRMHGAASEIALDVIGKDGRRCPMMINAVQKRTEDGRPVFNRITIFDATERRRYEQELLLARKRAEQVAGELAHRNDELRRANADIEQFAFSASHDLKEPLRMLGIYAELLRRTCESRLQDSEKQYLHFMVEGASRMQALLDDLLAYTQATHRTHEPVDLISADWVMQETIASLEPALRESGADIQVAGLPSLRVHQIHLRQLFQNLIGNALKYRSSAPPVIRISAAPAGALWMLCVQDNGIGLEPQYAEQAFGLFKRLHPRQGYTGTGIGLAICRKIVEQYGGRIWVDSAGAGQGATFCFTLPGSDIA